MRRRLSFVAVIGLLVSVLTVGAAGLSASSATSDSPTRIATKSKAARPDHLSGRSPSSQRLDFEVVLQVQHQAEANAMVQAVADPASPLYHRYLSSADFLARYAPSEAAVTAIQSWLHKQGITTEAASADRLSVPAHGTVAQIERAFSIHLNTYKYGDKTARLADQDMALPSSLASLVSGTVGIDDFSAFTRPALVSDSQAPAAKPAAGSPFPLPPGFKNAPPCSQPWGQKIDTTDPALVGFANPLPYTPCGETPTRLRTAYGVDAAVDHGNDGSGVTVAIIDAYASPTLFADARHYSSLHDAAHTLKASQFSELLASKFTLGNVCGASGWYGEQSLDVEMVHSLAPGANILFLGAESCSNTALFNALHKVVLGHLAQIVSNSYGNLGEIVPAGYASAFVELTMDAALQGIGVYFSSGDAADELTNFPVAQPDFEPSTPFVTGVGGTALATGAGGSRMFEVGWEEGRSALVSGAWVPGGAGTFRYGAGGGTSSVYAQPAYQKGVVPDALANARTDVVGAPMPGRVVPDVAAVAAVSTGVLVGETQAFADSLTGTAVDNRYGEFRLGGTSVSSPVFAGIMALADQKAGFAHGFANFALYKVGKAFAANGPFHDIVPASPVADIRLDYVDAITFNPAAGFAVSSRTYDYAGLETFCTNPADPTTCTSKSITLHTAVGYDNVTGLGTPNGPAFLDALS